MYGLKKVKRVSGWCNRKSSQKWIQTIPQSLVASPNEQNSLGGKDVVFHVNWSGTNNSKASVWSCMQKNLAALCVLEEACTCLPPSWLVVVMFKNINLTKTYAASSYVSSQSISKHLLFTLYIIYSILFMGHAKNSQLGK